MLGQQKNNMSKQLKLDVSQKYGKYKQWKVTLDQPMKS